MKKIKAINDDELPPEIREHIKRMDDLMAGQRCRTCGAELNWWGGQFWHKDGSMCKGEILASGDCAVVTKERPG